MPFLRSSKETIRNKPNFVPFNGLVTYLNSSPKSRGTVQDWFDLFNDVNMEQKTVDNQPALVDGIRVFGGINDFMVQEEIANGSGLTFFSDGPFMNLLDGEARCQLPGTPGAYINTDATHVVVITDSDDKVICYGYPRVADSALAFGAELHTLANAMSDPNGNEADATTGWNQVNLDNGANVFASQGVIKNVGSYAIEANSNPNPAGGSRFYMNIQSVFGLIGGQLYKLSFVWRHVGGGGEWSLKIATNNQSSSSQFTVSVTNVDTTFQTVTAYFVHVTDLTEYAVFVETNGPGDGGVYVDNFSCEPVTNLGETAALIWNTPSGSGAQSWLRGDGDPNDPATLAVRKSDLNFTGSFTIGMLVKPDDGQTGTHQGLAGKWLSIAGLRSFLLWNDPEGKIRVQVSADGSAFQGMITNAAVFANGVQTAFTFLILVVDTSDSTMRIYVNGVEVATDTNVGVASLLDVSVAFEIGSDFGGAAVHWGGEIADLPIFNRALSAAEVLEIANGLAHDGWI